MAFSKRILLAAASLVLFACASATRRIVDCANVNICFAIDGSASISDDEFTLQKEFVKLLIGTYAIDQGTQFAVLQYGLRPQYVSRLAPYSDSLLYSVHGLRSLMAGTTYIAPSITNCMRQFARVPGEPNKMILLGDGRSNFDSLAPPLDPKSIAQQFLSEPNNEMSAVAVNFNDEREIQMLTDIVGDRNKVYTAENWITVFELIDSLVEEVCEVTYA
eukprot:TRINITY_DN1750_c0_g1_i1.p1 TRINITY_DN1750_c0_g1~~TRINITY_DN1750_c0_g1_i1.p1  ORF type:complete len:218 (-),score=42.29 TRINITY_DN1750_c0_g1_i1:246-899(-)